MRRLVLSLSCCCLLYVSPVVGPSAAAPSAALQGSSQEPEEADPSPEALPDDPFADTADDQNKAEQTEQDNHGEGETSWEHMNAEREPEVAPSRDEEPPETFSPLLVWRMIRGLWSRD